MAGRGSTLKSHEVSRAVRVRGPKLLEKLSRLGPSELGAWAYHAEAYLSKTAPELSLEHPPKPITEEVAAFNEKLAKVLETAQPVRFKKLWRGLGLSQAEAAEDERYWQELEKEKRAALKREQKRELDS